MHMNKYFRIWLRIHRTNLALDNHSLEPDFQVPVQDSRAPHKKHIFYPIFPLKEAITKTALTPRCQRHRGISMIFEKFPRNILKTLNLFMKMF